MQLKTHIPGKENKNSCTSLFYYKRRESTYLRNVE